jgi:hypothetical protein
VVSSIARSPHEVGTIPRAKQELGTISLSSYEVGAIASSVRTFGATFCSEGTDEAASTLVAGEFPPTADPFWRGGG